MPVVARRQPKAKASIAMNGLLSNHHMVEVSRMDCAFYVRFKHPLVSDFVVHLFGFY